jgi:hypothetical protein
VQAGPGGAAQPLCHALDRFWCPVRLMAKGTGHPKGLDWEDEIGVGPLLV